MKNIVNYEEFMVCLESLYTDTDYGTHPTPSYTHACNLRATLEKLVEDKTQKISLIDVGCGRGQVMEFYDFSGWEVSGTEIVTRLLAVDLLSFEEIYPYAVSDLKRIPDKEYDFVFFVNVLDHVWKPEDIVVGIEEGQRIAKYGIVVICDGEDNFQTVEFPRWQWKSLFGSFDRVEFFEHETGFIRILALNKR